jgi:glycosyltransferase involved in cell wall biosynthesis
MAVGRPVVATLKGGAAEYLRPWENCLSFDAGSAVQLAGAVQRLAVDAALRATLREGGRETAAEHTAAAFNRRVEEELRARVTT